MSDDYKESQRRWALVVKEPLFQFLKHDPTGRKILTLFGDSQISHGKAAQAITEKFCLGLEPHLPEPDDEAHSPIIPIFDGLENKRGLTLFAVVGYLIGFITGAGTAFLIALYILGWHK
jgi:hypothetical protein